jgi:RING-finger-containing ubiquitin ligase
MLWILTPVILHYVSRIYVKPYYANTIIEIFQFTSIFWIAEYYNQTQLEKYDGCLFIGEDLKLYIIDAAFKVGLISYTISCACFLLFCVGVLLYLVVEHFYIGDRRRRPREKLKIEDLETIKFSLKDSSSIQGQHVCSICLVEFEDREDVVRTPICNHYFHHECLKKWISSHDECPYCRANIRQNLKLKNDMQSQRTMRDASVNPNEYQLNQSFELQPNSNIQHN